MTSSSAIDAGFALALAGSETIALCTAPLPPLGDGLEHGTIRLDGARVFLEWADGRVEVTSSEDAAAALRGLAGQEIALVETDAVRTALRGWLMRVVA